MNIIPITSAKGGAGKSTLAVLLFLAAREQGHKAILIDMDRGRSAYSWLAGDPDVLTAVTTQELDTILRRRTDAELVFVDTPPLYEAKRQIEVLLKKAAVIVTPVQPTPLAVERVPDLLTITPSDTTMVCVPSMIRSSTKSSEELKTSLREAGLTVTRDFIPLRESLAQKAGDSELGEWSGLFRGLLSEVLDAMKKEA